VLVAQRRERDERVAVRERARRVVGKLTAISVVSGRISARSSSRSGAQPCSGRSAHPLTSAPERSVSVSIDW
jgi:hypothetical protein